MVADTDGDGLNDGAEVNTYHSDPFISDSDGDGFGDGFEVSTGYNPASSLSTPEVQSGLRKAIEFRFNAASGVSYRIEGSVDTQTLDGQGNRHRWVGQRGGSFLSRSRPWLALLSPGKAELSARDTMRR